MKIITQSSWFEDDEPRRLRIECDDDKCEIDADEETMRKIRNAVVSDLAEETN